MPASLERALTHRSYAYENDNPPTNERLEFLGDSVLGLAWKTSRQELTAVKMLGVPDYRVEESGPDHQKSFRATVRVGGQVLGAGQGRTKKAAEQQAAEVAWRAITAESEGLAPENGRE